jgi:Protein of unknown function (DUF3268).
MELKDSEVIYGRSYGNSWVCANFPQCNTYVGCHKGTDTPLGTPANSALRKARSKAHAAFDPLWRSGEMTRSAAYAWLAEKMGIPKDLCHIAMFDEGQCENAVWICIAREVMLE